MSPWRDEALWLQQVVGPILEDSTTEA